MNCENSYIWSQNPPAEISSVYCDPVLVKAGEAFSLYRVARDGKYFIIKVATDRTGAMESLIRREYELSIGLSHPNIVNVFTYENVSPVGPGMLMEYIDGRSLAEFLAEKPSMQLRRRVLDQLLDAVAYIHRKGIIHNDLKPENILITRVDNTLKLIDFGLSENDAYYLTRNLGCTPAYASPELLNQQQTDSRSDIYSLGLLIRDILGGSKSRVWKKASHQIRDKRYSNVDQLQRALARGRNIALSALALCVIASVALSIYIRPAEYHETITYVQDTTAVTALKNKNDSLRHRVMVLEEENVKKLSKQKQIDSLRKEINMRIADLYEPLLSAMPDIKTQIELTYALGDVGYKLLELRKSYYSKISDEEIINAIDFTFSRACQEYYGKCMAEGATKPF